MKLLVVDDEPSIREGIRASIDWEALDIRCMTARDGLDALDIAEEERPELILLDIRMPKLDGLGVMEALKARGNAAKVIVLSGHDQFSYAQKALQLGAVDYLIKPCHKEDLKRVVLHWQGIIAQESGKRTALRQIRQQFEENLPVLQEQFLIKLLVGKPMEPEDIRDGFEALGLRLALCNVRLAVIEMEDGEGLSGGPAKRASARDVELAIFGVGNIAQEILGARCACRAIRFNGMVIAFITGAASDPQPLSALLTEVKDRVLQVLGVRVTIGVGAQAAEISAAASSYRQAMRAGELKSLLGAGEVVFFEQAFLSEEEQDVYASALEEDVLHAITSGKAAELYRSLDAFFAAPGGAQDVEKYKKRALALCYAINHSMLEYAIRNRCAWESADASRELLHLAQREKIQAVISRLAIEAQRLVLTTSEEKRHILEKAAAYIDAHYQQDISLRAVAEHVYLSPSYFSMLFKQLAGVTFVDYLNSVRISKACELLQDIRYKTYEVAFLAGFRNEKHFSYTFKKITGQTPGHYRRSRAAP